MVTVGVLRGVAVALVVFSGGCAGLRSSSTDGPPTALDAAAGSSSLPDDSDSGVDPARFTPYFTGRPAIVEAIEAEDWRRARELLLELAEELPESSSLPVRARFAAAMLSYEVGDYATALVELPELLEALPLLADHARYRAAISAYRVNEFDRAAALASEVSAESPLQPSALLIRGDALRALSQWSDVEELYSHYVHRHRGGPRLAEATYKLAEAIEQQLGDPPELERVRDAVRWYRRVLYRYPRGRWARDATVRLEVLARHLPDEEASEVTALSAAEQLERAEAFARVHRHSRAIREFSQVLELADPDGPVGCQARLGLGRAAYKDRQRQRASEVLIETAHRCDDPDLRAWSLYLAARSRTSRGDERGAVELYEELERDHPEHRLADDARLRRAQAELRMGRADEFARLIEQLPALYPEGDMRCDARWHLGWHQWRDGEIEQALESFDAGDELCDDPEEGAGGRERYWAGRALARLGRQEAAAAAYREVIVEHPLSYYMLLAAARLEALDPAALRRRLGGLAEAAETDMDGWSFDPESLQSRPGFLRGIELYRLGLGEMAELEFSAVDAELDEDDPLRWLTALLHHQVGNYSRSHWIARRKLTAWRERYPVGRDRRYWEIAYPRGFADLVEREAEAAGIEPELMWAVMREESGFTPTIESYANAVGLLQLLPSTASRFAQGLRADRVGLKQPENNVPIAARFLSFLSERQDGQEVLIVGSYNAGEGAVDRWRRRDPSLELDEALESFSYDQTRRYTRRVLSSYGAYHAMYGGGRLPRLVGAGGPIELSPPRAPAADAAASSPSD